MRFPVGSPFLNRTDRLKPSLVKGHHTFDQRQVFNFWNSLSLKQKEEMLTISDDRIVRDLADSFNAFVFMSGIENASEAELPFQKVPASANSELQVLLMDLNKLIGYFKHPLLKSVAGMFSIIIVDVQKRSTKTSELDTKTEKELNSASVIEATLGDISLLKNRRGLVKIKLTKISNVLQVFNSIIKYFCYGSKPLLQEKDQAEIYSLFFKQFIKRLESFQEDDRYASQEVQNENAEVSTQEGAVREKTQVGNRRELKPKLHEMKTVASLLSLMFLFENRILNAFADWTVLNYTKLTWTQSNSYMMTPNCLLQQNVVESTFNSSVGWRTNRHQVFERYHGIYFGSLAFPICDEEWEEQSYSHEISSTPKKLEAQQQPNIGANLRRGTPVLEEILGKPFPCFVEQQYMNHENYHYSLQQQQQHPHIYPNFNQDVPWVGPQNFTQRPSGNFNQTRRHVNINKEKRSYRQVPYQQAPFDQGNQNSYNSVNQVINSLINMPKATKTPAQVSQFPKNLEANNPSKEAHQYQQQRQHFDLHHQNGKQNSKGQFSESNSFKSKGPVVALPKEQIYESENHFELIHSTLSDNVKMMKKQEKNL